MATRRGHSDRPQLQTAAHQVPAGEALRSVTVLSLRGSYLVGFAGRAGPTKYGTAHFTAVIIDREGQRPAEAYHGVANDAFFLNETPLDYGTALTLVASAAAEGVYPPACPDIASSLTIEGYHVVGPAKETLQPWQTAPQKTLQEERFAGNPRSQATTLLQDAPEHPAKGPQMKAVAQAAVIVG
ncbi:hypothetical protein WJX73_003678 [Symbiochloris irregularis]|uniref:Uncharacterized protein n=1 Tax=Symbiochloris irregularis TaxID=706552 RepID=A0AAW1PEM0_9CHLO